MTTFDEILPKLKMIFQLEDGAAQVRPILINRDLNGRVRLIIDEKWRDEESQKAALNDLTKKVQLALDAHAFPAEAALLFEPELERFIACEATFPLEGCSDVFVVDRLVTEGNWAEIEPAKVNPPRIAFFSIKGGVGRSTALAAVAWALAERGGKRVMVLDLDLESPGLSSALLPEDRRPVYGITDWLVEDLVGNGDAIFQEIVATSELSRNAEILVVPAHGKDPGEYISKLGRAWMPKIAPDGHREPWSKRLHRLLDELEKRWAPEVVLIDSRAGIDETASACVTDLGASTVLLFAIDGDQTWSGYQTLFRHWRRTETVRKIRERLQVVGAMLPDTGTLEYFDHLRERAWNAFSEDLYDEVPPGQLSMEGELWSFDEPDEAAPHFPWGVRWHRGFAALRSLHGKLHEIGNEEIDAIFGPLINGVSIAIKGERDEE